MTSAIQKFKEMLDGVETAAIQVGNDYNTQKLVAATLLHRTFEHLGKQSVFELPTTTDASSERTKQFLTELCGPWEAKNPHEQLVIRLNAQETPVSKLKYEKDGDTLKIILEGLSAVDPAHVSIQKEKTSVDLLLLVDPALNEIEGLIAGVPHQDVIKLTSKDRSLFLKVADIVVALVDPLSPEFCRGLWYLLEQEEKLAEAPLAEITEMKQRVLVSGIDREVIRRARANFLGSSFWKLLGRALARCEFEKNIQTIWSFLPYADFQKTNQTSSVILNLLEEIQALRPDGTYIALLWEDKNITSSTKRIRAVIAGKTESVISQLAVAFGAQPASRYFFLNEFETFSEAELRIRSTIQQLRNV